MNKTIAPIIEGGLLVSLTVVMGLITIYIPLIGILFEFFCALPLAVLTTRQGICKGLTALVATFIMLSIFLTPLVAFRLVVNFCFCGIILGAGVRKNLTAIKIFISTLLAALIAQGITLIFLMLVMDVNILADQTDLLRESFNETLNIYETIGLDRSQIEEARTHLEPALQIIIYLMPTILILSSLISTLVIWFTARLVFAKIQIQLPKFSPFINWKFPKFFVWLAIFSLLGLYWGTTREWTNIYSTSLNLLAISMFVGLLQGLSLMAFLLNNYRISKLLRRILYVMILLNMFFLQVVAIIGLMDIFLDLRQQMIAKDKEGD